MTTIPKVKGKHITKSFSMVVSPGGNILCVLPEAALGLWKIGACLSDYVSPQQKHEFTQWFESISKREHQSESISIHLRPSNGVNQSFELSATTISQCPEHEHVLVTGREKTKIHQEHHSLTQAKEAAESINALKANCSVPGYLGEL